MVKKTIVLSLGGSLIIPDKINLNFLEKFRKTLLKNKKKYKFVVVCGGGKTARNYIKGLDYEKNWRKKYFQSLLGISITRLNARFMTYFFGKDANQGIPSEIKQVKNSLNKNDIVFCGALRYEKNQTSDAVSARLARFLNCPFVNLTNVKGLYEKDPRRFRSAKFIPEISYRDFYKMIKKIKFKPGQHFVLDQTAAKIILKYKIKTFILGSDMKNLDNFLNKKHFVGTVIDK